MEEKFFATFKEIGFKNHPLAPCVVAMYETIKGTETLSGLIVVETDDLFGGGIGPNFQQKAVETLR